MNLGLLIAALLGSISGSASPSGLHQDPLERILQHASEVKAQQAYDGTMIGGDCDGEALENVLDATDVLYLSLHLRGNADNALYRLNFYGLSRRTDYVPAGEDPL